MSELIKTSQLVSVVMPLYNAQSHVASAIKSVQAQTHKNWELLIVDDCSTDDSTQLVSAFAKADPRICLFRQPKNQGAAHARNRAINEAKGDFIAFLDADDQWLPEKLAIQLKAMTENNVAVCHSSYEHIDVRGSTLGKTIQAIPQLAYEKHHKNNYVGNLTGMYNAKKLGKIYAPLIRKRQDWALWLEAIKMSGQPALGIQQTLAQYRIHEGNMSGNKVKLVKYNYHFYRTYLKYGALKSAYWLCRFLWEYFFVRPKYIVKSKE